MRYFVVFDVTQTGYRQWPFAAFGLIFVAIGIALLVYRTRIRRPFDMALPIACLGFAIFCTAAASVSTAWNYFALSSDLRAGRCTVTEGVVTDFDPMPYGGHRMESFVVNGFRFKYSDYVIVAGFNNAASHGGPIRNGIRVRVHHRGNDIAKLEVAR